MFNPSDRDSSKAPPPCGVMGTVLGAGCLWLIAAFIAGVVGGAEGLWAAEPAGGTVVDTGTVTVGNTRLHLRLEMGEDASIQQGKKWCANPRKNPELRGPGVLVAHNPKARDRINLGEQLFIRKNGNWVSPDQPLRVLRGPRGDPWAIISQYANCNGFHYSVIQINPTPTGPKLQPMTFQDLHGPPRPTVYGNRIGAWPGRNAAEWRLWVEGYDNAVLGPFRVLYRWVKGENRLFLVGLTSGGKESSSENG